MAKTKLRKSITDVGYAPLQVADDGTCTYADVIWFPHNEAGGREYSADPNGEVTEVYADGVSVYMGEENHGYDVSLTLLRVTDYVDEAWLGKTVEDAGVFEYANNNENPKFALVVVESTTDGIGETRVFYNCGVTERPSEAGKTTEGAGFDPEFPVYTIGARPRPDTACVMARIPGKERFTKLPQPDGTSLKILRVGDTALSPAFVPSNDTYTASTKNSADVIVAIASDESATVEISNGGTTLKSGDAATWSSGSNTLTVTVTTGEKSKTYTVTVTKS